MKQFQMTYENDESFFEELEKINHWRSVNPSYTTLFRIYSSDMDMKHIKHVCDILDEKMPDALYLGCTTNANILEGKLANAKIVLSCTIFEYETTQVKVLQFPFLEENAKEVAHALKEYTDANTWVSSVEVHVTMLGMSDREFCGEMSTLRSDIQVVGGVACGPNLHDIETSVFSKGNDLSRQGIVFLLIGGSDFHTYSTYVSGWKPLRRKFNVTKAKGRVIYELDGEPAFNIYHRFLSIDKDNENLALNTLEFPILMDYNGIDVLRCLYCVNDDDSIVMLCEMDEGSDVRLAYGDPEMIINSIRKDGQNIADFRPEVIQTFSCSGRRSFWGDESVSDETLLFNDIAPVSGFYTGGELLRIDGDLRTFNITLVLVAMREGEPKNDNIVNLYDATLGDTESDRITLIRRFISFIEASTADFEELNKKLAIASITDGLTSLYNRAEIEGRIRSEMEHTQGDASGGLSLIMIDIDNFKRINDVYGHKEGDRVIIALSDVLRKVTSDIPSSYTGRWGGEEFMVLLPSSEINEAIELAEKLRMEFEAIFHEAAGHQTVSIGVTHVRNSEDADALYSRVDKALYMAKANGKNQVIRLD